MLKITRDDIRDIDDAASLMQFLREKLALPIPEGLNLSDVVVPLPPYTLGLSGDIADQFLDCQKLQVFSGDNSENPEPWVLFLVRFNTNQGYESVLRDICPALEQHAGGSVPFRFICTDEELQPFAFAYFSDSAGGDWQAAELTILAWPQENTTVRVSYEHELPQELIFEPIPLPPPPPPPSPPLPRERLLAKLQSTETRLIQPGTIYSGGIVTGLNDAFVISESKRQQLIAQDLEEDQLIRPLAPIPRRKKWSPERKHVIWIPSSQHKQWPWSVAKNEATAERIFADTYPAISEHLHGYKEDLKNPKAKHRGEFYWELKEREQHLEDCYPRIIYPSGSSMRACYVDWDAVLLYRTFFIPTTDLSLLAVLNSKLFSWWARSECFVPSQKRLEFKRGIMEGFPVAQRTEEQKAAIAEYVQLILDEPDSHEVPAFEEEIDALVYALYGLTDAEIALIEENR